MDKIESFVRKVCTEGDLSVLTKKSVRMQYQSQFGYSSLSQAQKEELNQVLDKVLQQLAAEQKAVNKECSDGMCSTSLSPEQRKENVGRTGQNPDILSVGHVHRQKILQKNRRSELGERRKKQIVLSLNKGKSVVRDVLGTQEAVGPVLDGEVPRASMAAGQSRKTSQETREVVSGQHADESFPHSQTETESREATSGRATQVGNTEENSDVNTPPGISGQITSKTLLKAKVVDVTARRDSSQDGVCLLPLAAESESEVVAQSSKKYASCKKKTVAPAAYTATHSPSAVFLPVCGSGREEKAELQSPRRQRRRGSRMLNLERAVSAILDSETEEVGDVFKNVGLAQAVSSGNVGQFLDKTPKVEEVDKVPAEVDGALKKAEETVDKKGTDAAGWDSLVGEAVETAEDCGKLMIYMWDKPGSGQNKAERERCTQGRQRGSRDKALDGPRSSKFHNSNIFERLTSMKSSLVAVEDQDCPSGMDCTLVEQDSSNNEEGALVQRSQDHSQYLADDRDAGLMSGNAELDSQGRETLCESSPVFNFQPADFFSKRARKKSRASFRTSDSPLWGPQAAGEGGTGRSFSSTKKGTGMVEESDGSDGEDCSLASLMARQSEWDRKRNRKSAHTKTKERVRPQNKTVITSDSDVTPRKVQWKKKNVIASDDDFTPVKVKTKNITEYDCEGPSRRVSKEAVVSDSEDTPLSDEKMKNAIISDSDNTPAKGSKIVEESDSDRTPTKINPENICASDSSFEIKAKTIAELEDGFAKAPSRGKKKIAIGESRKRISTYSKTESKKFADDTVDIFDDLPLSLIKARGPANQKAEERKLKERHKSNRGSPRHKFLLFESTEPSEPCTTSSDFYFSPPVSPPKKTSVQGNKKNTKRRIKTSKERSVFSLSDSTDDEPAAREKVWSDVSAAKRRMVEEPASPYKDLCTVGRTKKWVDFPFSCSRNTELWEVYHYDGTRLPSAFVLLEDVLKQPYTYMKPRKAHQNRPDFEDHWHEDKVPGLGPASEHPPFPVHSQTSVRQHSMIHPKADSLSADGDILCQERTDTSSCLEEHPFSLENSRDLLKRRRTERKTCQKEPQSHLVDDDSSGDDLPLVKSCHLERKMTKTSHRPSSKNLSFHGSPYTSVSSPTSFPDALSDIPCVSSEEKPRLEDAPAGKTRESQEKAEVSAFSSDDDLPLSETLAAWRCPADKLQKKTKKRKPASTLESSDENHSSPPPKGKKKMAVVNESSDNEDELPSSEPAFYSEMDVMEKTARTTVVKNQKTKKRKPASSMESSDGDHSPPPPKRKKKSAVVKMSSDEEELQPSDPAFDSETDIAENTAPRTDVNNQASGGESEPDTSSLSSDDGADGSSVGSDDGDDASAGDENGALRLQGSSPSTRVWGQKGPKKNASPKTVHKVLVSKKSSENRKEEHPYLKRLRLICRKVGIFVRNDVHFAGCQTDSEKIESLKEALKKVGMKGQPSLSKVDSVNLKREAADLDAKNIIQTTGRPRRQPKGLFTRTHPPKKSLSLIKQQFSGIRDLMADSDSD